MDNLSLHPLEKKVVKALLEGGEGNIEHVAALAGISIDQARRATEWLRAKGLIRVEEKREKLLMLGESGKMALLYGFPEERIANLVIEGGSISVQDLGKSMDKNELKAALGRAVKNGWIEIKNGMAVAKTKEKVKIEKTLLDKIANGATTENQLNASELKNLEELLRRPGYVEYKDLIKTNIALEKGITQSLPDLNVAESTTLTAEMISSGKWKDTVFSKLDISAPAPPVFVPRIHPLSELIEYIKEVMVSLGFEEVEGQIIRSSFWNFDVLFTPQDHPARDMHDTFYVEGLRFNESDKQLVERVKETHQNGWVTGSTGWKYNWNADIANKAVLRTHTTTITAEQLYKTKKGRIFTVGRVFRNEKPDFKHLVELHQLDAVVAGEEVSISRLMGFLTAFYSKLGFKRVKFWPTFFPYTEPSMQSMIYSDKLNDWIELCGMGIFRPEVTKPLGLDGPVMAWGMGLERLAMLIYDIDDIRELYENRLSLLRNYRPFFTSL
ncbi:MAG: phenylalanine--tRNA ligase subunit alpha [Nitrososphaerota archaeon]|jgi:phenylalanyl-tRNA synthetase alpha chain|nr:phenylalanine--tRNA ligase subunit alpha [Nitrososphaerota archaeon]MDG6927254.1 phenylalanine--tRNA ligase subunit alpha [Nitrososphaerota archaeon]MDG6930388.1 phenylalanine--tRNA ligase subunit alpha [Nitrososphaerota archaeon]MDG6932595.1 phenylalanine--tRNA ligase subunit alpha [Nitrososphaerota archaeon]MDG6935667.1 phenylalanine--tRNA ligase subunit alpha [Nitrososphaerota archaeon]